MSKFKTGENRIKDKDLKQIDKGNNLADAITNLKNRDEDKKAGRGRPYKEGMGTLNHMQRLGQFTTQNIQKLAEQQQHELAA